MQDSKRSKQKRAKLKMKDTTKICQSMLVTYNSWLEACNPTEFAAGTVVTGRRPLATIWWMCREFSPGPKWLIFA